MESLVHETPESEFSIECFQNYTASEVFTQSLAGIVNQGDIEVMIRAQKQMLQRFEKTNEMLLNCNALSCGRLKPAVDDFKKHIKILNDMKKELDYIFRKLRIIKIKTMQQYPEAYNNARTQKNVRVVDTNLFAEKKYTKNDSDDIEYVQMDESGDNGKSIENEILKKMCSMERSNDSSDWTSEDTG